MVKLPGQKPSVLVGCPGFLLLKELRGAKVRSVGFFLLR